jgi:hypothetical protein
MKELTPEEMKLISGGLAVMRQPQFGPGLIARLILGALFFDFGADRPPVTVAPAN